jgi:hypothetical protein
LVKRSLTTSGGSNDNLDVGVDEVIVGVSELGLIWLVLKMNCM